MCTVESNLGPLGTAWGSEADSAAFFAKATKPAATRSTAFIEYMLTL